MTGYSVEIVESSKELTVREKIALKDYSNAIALDSSLEDVDQITIYPTALLRIFSSASSLVASSSA